MAPHRRIVLDSWAVVHWLQEEPGAIRIREYFELASRRRILIFMSYINAGEVYYAVAKNRGLEVAEQFLRRLPELPIELVAPDADDILEAARIKARYAVAYGDAFAICLGRDKDAAVATGDREIRESELVRVEWLG
ncbi:MAG: type II toxin-antitoxin system VapC family toxin [Bryobacteraceae bacterium]